MDVAKWIAKERNDKKNMDSASQINMVEHIRKRVGMYWPMDNGIPDASVWREARPVGKGTKVEERLNGKTI